MSNSSNVVLHICTHLSRTKKALCRIPFWCVIILLFSAGCATEQRASELYVDAVMLVELDENEKAVEKLNSAVRLNKRFSLAYSLLGEIHQQLKDYEKSAASYEKATKLNPWSFKDYFNLGRVCEIMKKFAQAVKAYAKACELEPDHFDAHISTAKCYYEIEDYNNALVYGERAEQIDPNISEVQKVLGDIYESQRDHNQAIAAYKRALELDSNSPEIMTSLAVCYLRTNRSKCARELLTLAIQIQPDNNTAYQYLGYCHLQSYYQAISSYRRELETAGEETELTASLKAKAYEAIEKALQSYNRALAINDKDWKAYKGLGVAYVLKARANEDESLKAKGVAQWRLSLKIKPDQPRREELLKLIRIYSK